MARIETYVAQRALQPGQTPGTSYSTAVAQELGSVGGEVSNFAATLIQRQEQRENFKVENDKRRLELELARDMQERALNITPGGEGFHEQFMTEVFKPKRDAFLASVPERLRPQFAEALADDTGAAAVDWSIRAATTERDESYRWQKQEIGLTQEQLANAIALNPEGYDAILADGQALIDASSLPTAEKQLATTEWRKMAAIVSLDTLLQKDPHGVFRVLGMDARNLSPQTQLAVVLRAVQWQESRDNPNAVSAKGAVGLMQVMPGTAADVARQLGDTDFPHGAPENVIRAYLSNPYVSKRYGEAYLREQLKTFANTPNPIETALIAYNGGPERAKEWVESGYDDSVLPKETRDYKDAILSSIVSEGAKSASSSVKFVGSNGKGLTGVNPDLTARVADAYGTLGLDTVKFNSGHRTEAENEAAGGAEHSQHLKGGAIDIDVSGKSHAERIEIIKALSASGVTGLGIGANIIHADLGGRRAWGYATSAGGGEVPKWAQGVIAEHLAGTVPPVLRIADRYSAVPYDVRQRYLNAADTAISAEQTAAARSTAVEKVQVRQQRDNELALVRATGAGSPNFDETAISTILGEDDYLKFTTDRDTARRTFTAVQGISTMTVEEMASRFDDYAPRPGDDFGRQQQIQTAVQREIDRVTRLRASRPDKAAMEFPQVAKTYDTLNAAMAAGDVPPADIQSFVKLMLEAQGELAIKPEARAPIPREWAVEIGKALSRVPEPQRGNAQELQATVIAQYEALQATFGDYADEVITYALSEYTGIGKDQAEMLTAYATQMGASTGIFRKKAADAFADRSQADDFAPRPGFGGTLFGDPFGFTSDEEGDGLTAEERLRRKEAEESAQ